MKKAFKVGDIVEVKISVYPYIRVGKIIGKKGKNYLVRVEYPSKFMILNKTVKKIERVI